LDSQAHVSSGIAGLDEILQGGYPRGRITLIEGAPGTGKTTASLQFLIAAVERGERAVFLSVAQSRDELEAVAASHGLDLSGIDIISPSIEDAADEVAVSVSSDESSLLELVNHTGRALDERRPDVFVFDSLLELRLLSSGDIAYRRNLLALRRRLREARVTGLLLDHIGAPGQNGHESGILHGVVRLEGAFPPIGAMHRRLSVLKMRGSAFREGYHDFRIRQGGLVVFPRILPEETAAAGVEERLELSESTLNRMLGGGLEFGTTTLISGQAGTGKSTVAAHIAADAAQKGIASSLFLFEERPEVFRTRSESLGIGLGEHERNDLMALRPYHPAEISPGEFSRDVIQSVENGARVVVIDSLSGYVNALADRHNVLTHLHTLLKHLSRRGCLVVVTLAQRGLVGESPESELDTSYLADSIILLRQYAHQSQIRRSIAVLKKRHSEHERGIQELIIRSGAVEVKELSQETSESAVGATQLGGN
jgi:circadian clock protein KaiC